MAEKELVDLIAQLPVAKMTPTQKEYGIFRNTYMPLVVEMRRRTKLPLDEAEWDKNSAASLHQNIKSYDSAEAVQQTVKTQDKPVARRLVKVFRKKLEE